MKETKITHLISFLKKKPSISYSLLKDQSSLNLVNKINSPYFQSSITKKKLNFEAKNLDKRGNFNQAKRIQTSKAELKIDPVFPQRRRREVRRKKHFDENLNDSSEVVFQSREEFFRVNFFLCIVDQAIASLNRRFEQYQEFENVFGFLFNFDKLNSLEDESLKACCTHLESALMNGGNSDIDGNDLYMELRFIINLLHEERQKMGRMFPIDILKFLKRFNCFPNASIAYRIMLTTPVTVASAERSFSKLKLLKSHMRSTMTQERLNGLATISIENEHSETFKLEELIDQFASKNARRTCYFK